MNNTKHSVRRWSALLICALAMIFLFCQNTFAAQGAFTINVSSANVSPGETFSVTVNISFDAAISNYSYNIYYDSSLLQYVSGGTPEYDGCVGFAGTGSPSGNIFTFKALSEGSATLEVILTELVSTGGEYIDISPAYSTMSVSSQAAATEAVSTTEAITTTENAAVTEASTERATEEVSEATTKTDEASGDTQTATEEESSLDKFMDKNKFVIMLIAVIVLVVLIVVIVILAISMKNLIKEYEAELDRLEDDNHKE